jgi:erythromycin esterase
MIIQARPCCTILSASAALVLMVLLTARPVLAQSARETQAPDSAAKAQQPGDSAVTIEAGVRIERPLAAGELHAYALPAAAGSFLHVQVELTRVGVAIVVYGAGGEKLAEDTSAFYSGPQRLVVPTSTSGLHRIEMKGLGGSGRYEITVAARSPAAHEAWLEDERAADIAARAWLREHSIPLASVEAGHGFADMQPLRAIVGDARIVALGEATHGTREFFQLKHRMLEFLVEEMGFNIFGIEASLPEALEVNHYVLTGEGDPGRALAGMYFWVWDTEEVLELIEWMRRYNADPRHTRKVSFYGFDMQFTARAARVALEYLREVDAAAALTAQPVLEPMTDPFRDRARAGWQLEQWQALQASINEIAAGYDERRGHYSAASSAERWDLARRHVHILQQYTDMYATPDADYDMRDSAMAANVAWMLEREGPDSKAVLWAHNGHVATMPGMMGDFLRRRYGDAMRVFGFAFERGGFQARDLLDPGHLRAFRVNPAPEGTLDAALAAAGLPRAAIDLRALPGAGPVADWFRAAPATRDFGSGFSEDEPPWSWSRYRTPELYDALLFVAETEAARPNAATGRRFRFPPVLPAPQNTGFEESAPGTAPSGWWRQQGIAAEEWDAAVTRGNAPEGEHALVIRRAAERRHAETVGELQQRVDATPWRGQRVTLSAYVRVDPATRAYLWIEATAAQGTWSIPVAVDYMVDRPITAAEWRRYEVSVDVPENANTIVYGVAVVGDGAAWFDGVSLVREPPPADSAIGRERVEWLRNQATAIRTVDPADEDFSDLAAFGRARGMPDVLDGLLFAATLAITGVHVVDVESGTLHRDQTVLIGGDRIMAVGPADSIDIPPQVRVVDGRGKYLIPGLIDTHTHLSWDMDNLPGWRRITHGLARQLAHGVTAVREASTRGLERRQLEVRAAPGEFDFLLPRIYVSGRIDPAAVARYGAADSRDLTRQLVALGVDGLKIRNDLTLHEVQGVIAEARAAGVPVYGHAYAYPLGAVEAGIDGVMHVDGLLVLPAGGHPLPPPRDTTDWAAAWLHTMSGWLHRDVAAGDDLLRAMVARGTWLEPTLAVFAWIAEPEYYRDHPARYRGVSYEQLREGFPTPTGAAAAEARAAVAEMGKFVARFHELGGVIIAGTDSYVLDGMDLHEELRLLVRSGLTPAVALQAATINAARALSWDDRLGAIRAGYLADLVLLEANPLDDILNTRRIRAVVHGGRYLDRAALDGLPAERTAPRATLGTPGCASGSLHANEEQVYVLPLTQGSYLRIRVDGVAPDLPVSLTVHAPDGAAVASIATWQREAGEAEQLLLAESTGEHRVSLVGAAGATYHLRTRLLDAAEADSEGRALAAATAWLARASHSLLSVEAGTADDDLAPLQQILRDVRVVAIGEATHGTREFAQVKHRFLEYLVTHLGVTHFGLEASADAAHAINDYVLTGSGDRAALLAAQGFWNWDTEEIAATLDWMRDYNRAVPVDRMVHFFGFDFQLNPTARATVVSYLDQIAPERVAAVDSVLAVLTESVDSLRRDFMRYYSLPLDARQPIVAAMDDLHDFLESNRELLVQRTSLAGYDAAARAVHRLRQFADAHGRGGFAVDTASSGVATRDRYMAENILRVLRDLPPKARILLSMHNEHSRSDPDLYTTGHYLRQHLGDAYYAFNVSFDSGSFSALNLAEQPYKVRALPIGAAFPLTIDWFMRQAGKGDLFVDFRAAPASGPAGQWLSRPRRMRSIGGGHPPSDPGYYRHRVIPGTSFDGLIFIQRSTPARLNPTVTR